MWIRNFSRYSDLEVEQLVRLAAEHVDLDRVCINVKNGRLGGAAYKGVPEISNAPKDAKYLITIRVGRGNERWPLGPVNYHFKAPGQVGPRTRFPFFICDDWRQWLVKVAAHEAMHIDQFRTGRRCSEIECEQFSVKVLERYRVLQQHSQQELALF